MPFSLSFIFLLIIGVKSPDLPEPDYYRLTWQEFYRLPAVNRPIALLNPDYLLLNAAVFHASNKARLEKEQPALTYSANLQQAADHHAAAMIRLEFFGHYNLHQALYRTPDKRIQAFGGFFHATSENIAQYDIVDTGPEYCPIRQPDGLFKYVDCQTHQPYRVYTYLAYAEAVVAGWLRSPPHRATLLSDRYQYLGCAARFSKDPFKQKQVPFACLTQNFGGYRVPAADSTKKATRR